MNNRRSAVLAYTVQGLFFPVILLAGVVVVGVAIGAGFWGVSYHFGWDSASFGGFDDPITALLLLPFIAPVLSVPVWLPPLMISCPVAAIVGSICYFRGRSLAMSLTKVVLPTTFFVIATLYWRDTPYTRAFLEDVAMFPAPYIFPTVVALSAFAGLLEFRAFEGAEGQ